EKFEKGKDLAKDLQKEQEKVKSNASAATLVDKIKELADMKEKGIISEEEFEALKKKIIN
ncbi:MAG TPA: SHOCT domain-containing protein, partial [Saprospiraceae bacterium]|nr:SHOCT domain-containing protein [Saprospiraceae bacterium]